MVRLNSVSGIFFRFFAGIWLTLLLVGALVWGASSFFTEAPSNYGSFERSPAAERAIGTALGIARWGGEDALITWLKDPEVNTRPEVFVLDPFGHEISGRSIPQKAAESLANSGPQEGVYTMRGHGRHMRPFQGYRFFAVRTDIPPSPIRLIMWKMPWWGWTLIAALISVFVAGSVAWTSTRPIKKLQWAMQKASQGVFDVRIANEVGHEHDEIGELARQFDAMAARQEEHVAALPQRTLPPRRTLRARFERWEQVPERALDGVEYLILPIAQADRVPREWRAKTLLELPRVMFGALEQDTARRIAATQDAGFAGYEVSNIAHLRLCRGLPMTGGFGLNITNNVAAQFYAEQGLSSLLILPEVKDSDIVSIAPTRNGKPVPTGVMIYGHMPLLLTRACPLQNIHACARRTGGGLRCGLLYVGIPRGGGASSGYDPHPRLL